MAPNPPLTQVFVDSVDYRKRIGFERFEIPRRLCALEEGRKKKKKKRKWLTKRLTREHYFTGFVLCISPGENNEKKLI